MFVFFVITELLLIKRRGHDSVLFSIAQNSVIEIRAAWLMTLSTSFFVFNNYSLLSANSNKLTEWALKIMVPSSTLQKTYKCCSVLNQSQFNVWGAKRWTCFAQKSNWVHLTLTFRYHVFSNNRAIFRSPCLLRWVVTEHRFLAQTSFSLA